MFMFLKLKFYILYNYIQKQNDCNKENFFWYADKVVIICVCLAAATYNVIVIHDEPVNLYLHNFINCERGDILQELAINTLKLDTFKWNVSFLNQSHIEVYNLYDETDNLSIKKYLIGGLMCNSKDYDFLIDSLGCGGFDKLLDDILAIFVNINPKEGEGSFFCHIYDINLNHLKENLLIKDCDCELIRYNTPLINLNDINAGKCDFLDHSVSDIPEDFFNSNSYLHQSECRVQIPFKKISWALSKDFNLWLDGYKEIIDYTTEWKSGYYCSDEFQWKSRSLLEYRPRPVNVKDKLHFVNIPKKILYNADVIKDFIKFHDKFSIYKPFLEKSDNYVLYKLNLKGPLFKITFFVLRRSFS